MKTVLRIAIQKSGRLNEDSLRLIKECGIAVDNGHEQLKVTARNFPLEIFFLRNSDIPQYVEDNVADIAIIGENILQESPKQIQVIQPLGFSKCKVSLAIPKNEEYTGLSYFNGKRFATSYPNTLQQFLNKNSLTAEIHEISGSVEIAPNIGLSDAICDIVSTGSTLFKNGLKEVAVVLNSEAVLISSNNLNEAKQKLLQKLLFRINAVLEARKNKYVLLNAPNEKLKDITALLPGVKSPTVMPLAKEGWSSLHSVISENDFWDIIDKLKEAGAEGILVIPIEKMIS